MCWDNLYVYNDMFPKLIVLQNVYFFISIVLVVCIFVDIWTLNVPK